jgi:tRNA(adenine34) deaminase
MTTDFDIQMMQLALQLAQQAAEVGEVPVGAVVCQHQNIIAQASNRRELDQDPVGHAEILALRQAAKVLDSWRLDDCTLYVTLEPCAMCAGALVNCRLPRLVYGASDPKMGCVDTLYQLCNDERFNHRIEVIRGVMAEETGQILTDFFKARRGKVKPPKPRAQN